LFGKLDFRKHIHLVLFVIAAAAGAMGIFMLVDRPATDIQGSSSRASASENKNKIAADFDIPAVGGGNICLKDYRGKVVILDFWSIACGPCIEANKKLQSMYDEYGKMGLQIIGLSIDRNILDVENFLKKNPIKYPVGLVTDDVIKGYGGIFGIPQTFVLDREGRIVKRYEGYSELSAYQMEKMVKKLLAQ